MDEWLASIGTFIPDAYLFTKSEATHLLSTLAETVFLDFIIK